VIKHIWNPRRNLPVAVLDVAEINAWRREKRAVTAKCVPHDVSLTLFRHPILRQIDTSRAIHARAIHVGLTAIRSMPNNRVDFEDETGERYR
jgi:hypothetical protein